MGWDGPMTERQYLVWLAWLYEDYNRPSRADYYALKVAAACGDKKAEPMKFGRPAEMSHEEQLAMAKARARARAPAGIYTPPPEKTE